MIVRDRRGRPTGVLLESTSFLAESASRPEEAPAAVRDRLVAHGRRLASLGITRIGDAAVPEDVADHVVAALADAGIGAHPLLTGARIDSPAFVEGQTAKVLADGGEYCRFCFTARQVRVLYGSGLRAMLGPDRSLARALARRTGRPHREDDGLWHSGITLDGGRLPTMLAAAADSGSDLAVHTVGNGAVDSLLSTLEADRGLAAAVRVRAEHAMTIDRRLIARFADLRLPVVAQPAFVSAYGYELDLLPLPDPLVLMPFRDMLDAGVQLAFSSDYPAAELSPWAGIADAVTRRDRRGGTVGANQVLTLDEAFEAYTVTSAHVLGLDDVGTLEPGMRADVQWCDRDPFATTDVRETRVRATWRDGVAIHGQDGDTR